MDETRCCVTSLGRVGPCIVSGLRPMLWAPPPWPPPTLGRPLGYKLSSRRRSSLGFVEFLISFVKQTIFFVLERLVQLQLNQGPCSCVLGDCGDKSFRFKTSNLLSQFVPHIHLQFRLRFTCSCLCSSIAHAGKPSWRGQSCCARLITNGAAV